MIGMELGLAGTLVLALNLYAIYKIWNSGASTGGKIVWTALLFLLPVVGFILWVLFGPS